MVGVNEDTAPPPGHSFRVMRWSNNQRDVEVVLSPDQTVKGVGQGTHWHFHRALELTAYRTGHGTHFVGDHIGPYGEGDVVLFGENLPHAHDVHGPSSGLVLHWDFPINHPFWIFPETEVLAKIFREAERGLKFAGETANQLRSLLREIETTDRFTQLARFFLMLATISAAPENEKIPLSSPLFEHPKKSSHLGSIQEAIRYVAVNFREEISLERMLQVARMSKPTFTRQFRKHTGKTLTEFIQEVRLSAVSRELAATDVQITEIALRNGFSEISFFNRIFNRKFGCSPSVFRRKAQITSSSST